MIPTIEEIRAAFPCPTPLHKVVPGDGKWPYYSVFGAFLMSVTKGESFPGMPGKAYYELGHIFPSAIRLIGACELAMGAKAFGALDTEQRGWLFTEICRGERESDWGDIEAAWRCLENVLEKMRQWAGLQ